MDGFVKVANVGDLPADEMMLVAVDDERVLLANVEGSYYAISDTCSHEEEPLSEGYLEASEVECPWHGSLFDVKTGANTGPPAADPTPVYPVRVEGNDIMVRAVL